MEQAHLKCMVGAGPLAHERSFWVDGVGQRYESWTDAEQVTLSNGGPLSGEDLAPGLVPVLIVKEEQLRVLVQLPREVVMGGRRVWVDAGQLRR